MIISTKASSQWKSGIKASIPIALGYIPIAITFGVLAKQAGLATYEILIMSLWIYSGASQFVAVSMFSLGIGGLEIVLAAGILSIRHAILELYYNNRYSMLKLPWKIGLSLGLTDESFAFLSMVEDKSEEFMGGLMLSAYLSWVIGTLIGCIFAAIIPVWLSKSMEIGLYALFITLLIGSLSKKASLGWISVISMLLNWALSQYIDKGWAIVISIIIGAAIGMKFIGDDES